MKRHFVTVVDEKALSEQLNMLKHRSFIHLSCKSYYRFQKGKSQRNNQHRDRLTKMKFRNHNDLTQRRVLTGSRSVFLFVQPCFNIKSSLKPTIFFVVLRAAIQIYKFATSAPTIGPRRPTNADGSRREAKGSSRCPLGPF